MADMNSNNAEKRESISIMIGLAFVVVATLALAFIGFCFLNEPEEIIEGQAEATSVRVSGKLPGRVLEFYVQEGDMVKAGDTLVHIHSSLLEAKLMQAEAMEEAAAAQNKKVDAGTRTQIVTAAREMVAQAEAALTITKKTYDRMEALYQQGVMSEQKRDEAKAAYDAAVATKKAAESQLSLAISGAQKEDKESAEAMVTVAKGGVAEVESILEDQYLVAPCDGQIDQIYPEVGELVSLGAPIMSVLKVEDKYVVFNVRETLLNEMQTGDTLTVMIPALDKKEIKARIYYVRDLGSYATWKATKATGDWDSRTFEVKARPMENVPSLRPGMTVIYKK